jgi:PAS domain S-box-containing protein
MVEQGRADRAAWEGELFRLLVENVRDYAIFVVDPEGLVRTWSRGAESLLGYREDEILGRWAGLFYTPEDVEGDVPRREMREALESGRGDDDRWHVRKDGSRFWSGGVMTPLRDETGTLRGFAKIMRDRTVWWEAERARRESEDRFRGLMEQAPFSVQVLAPDGKTLSVNRAWEQLWGLTLDQIADYNMLEDPQLEAKGILGHIRRAFEGEPAVIPAIQYDPNETIPDRTRHRDPRRWVSAVAYPLKDAAGQVREVVLVHHDITERMRADLALRQSEERFRQLADAMPQIVWTARPDGHIDYYNKRWYQFTGRPEGGDVSWRPILHPDDVQPCLDRWYEAVGSGRPFEAEYRFRDRLTDKYRWHLGRALPVVGESGRIVKWFGTSTDIDDRKQAEAALRAARDDAEQANQAKNQFLAVLSHELRTPLNPILLAATAMLERPSPPEDIRPTLEMIEQNVSLQARLIDDLLDVMRIVRGKLPLHWAVLDCHELIGRAVEVCRGEFQGKNLRIITDLAAEHHHANADPARLQQVLWNLFRNAAKFTPEGGTITIRTRNRRGPGDGNEVITLEVSDTGIGIEPEVLPRIFDPFQQGETTITRKFGGLGLGLAICKGIVDAHGGSLAAESRGKDQGTTFRVVLEALPGPAEGRKVDRVEGGPAVAPVLTESLRILVVEDEPATLRLMARLLRRLGHAVTTASTVASAVEAFGAGELDLIVSDIGLPDGTGLDLMRKVKAVRPVPAIALTGSGMEDDIVRSRQAGFAAHMTKPIDFTKLEAMIRQVAG